MEDDSKFNKLVEYLKDEYKYYSRLINENGQFSIAEKDRFNLTATFIKKTLDKFNIKIDE